MVTSPLVDDREVVPEGSVKWGTFHQQYRLNGKLVAVGVVDISQSGISSVYCFYDPEMSHLSLGKYVALREIDFARAHQLEYYYLGFYIPTCPKMSYKGEYKPSELLCPTSLNWYPLEYHCLPLLREFKFTPFEPALALRRKELECTIAETIARLARLVEAKEVKLGSQNREESECTSAVAAVVASDISDEELKEGQPDGVTFEGVDLLQEFQPRFASICDIRSVPLRIRSGVIRAELLTEVSTSIDFID